MEDILVERFSWAQIETFKDYYNINDKVRLKRAINDDLDLFKNEDDDDFDDWDFKTSIKKERPINSFKGRTMSLPQKKKKKGKQWKLVTAHYIV